MEKESIKSGDSKVSRYSNRAVAVVCNICDKEMRSDKLKEHRGGKFCKKKLQ